MALPISDQATQNNQRLFKRYGRIFSTPNPTAFTQHAEKLSVWLGDHKAYYPAARPEIIKLLLMAQTTIRTSIGLPQSTTVPFNIYDYPDNPYSPSYKLLVESILPFEGQFIEPGLIAHIETLKHTIAKRDSNLLQVSGPDSLPSSSNREDRILGSLPTPSISSATSDVPDIQLIERPTPSASAHNASKTQSNPTVTPQNTTNQVKRVKKRKTLDLDALAQMDIEGLLLKKEKKNPAEETSVGDHAITPQPTPHDPLTSQQVSTEQKTLDTNDKFGENPSITEKALTIEESWEPNAQQESQQTTSPPIVDSSDTHMEVDGEVLTPKNNNEMDVKMRDQTQQVGTKDQEQNLQDLERPQSTQLNVEETLVPTTVASEIVVSLPPQPPKPDVLPQIIDVDAHEVMQPSTIPDEEAQRRTEELGDPEVATTEPAIDVMDTASPEPSTNQAPSADTPNRIPTPSPLPSESNAQSTVFTSDMRVLASQRGAKDCSRIIIQFDIPQTQFQQLSIWIERSKFQSTEKIKASICISLGCYLTRDLEEASRKNDNCNTFEKQVLATRTTWPPHGQLSVNIELSGSRQNLPLAPPLKVTPDNLVDISDFLKLDQNYIELNQYQDLSQFTYVLHAHFPTRAQLREVEEQRQKAKEWDEWVQNICRPLKNPWRPTA